MEISDKLKITSMMKKREVMKVHFEMEIPLSEFAETIFSHAMKEIKKARPEKPEEETEIAEKPTTPCSDDYKKPREVGDEMTPEIRSAVEMMGTMLRRRWTHAQDKDGNYRWKWDEIKRICTELNINYNDLVEHLQCMDSMSFDIQKYMNLSLEMDEDNGKPTIVITGKFR